MRKSLVADPSMKSSNQCTTEIKPYSPGPHHSYEFQSSLKSRQMSMGKNDPTTSFIYKVKKISEQNPPPGTYDPKFTLQENEKFKSIGLSKGGARFHPN